MLPRCPKWAYTLGYRQRPDHHTEHAEATVYGRDQERYAKFLWADEQERHRQNPEEDKADELVGRGRHRRRKCVMHLGKGRPYGCDADCDQSSTVPTCVLSNIVEPDGRRLLTLDGTPDEVQKDSLQ